MVKTAGPKGSQVELILDCLRAASGQDYIGEDVSQLEHALQCAFHASEAGGTEAQILAALFHDVGHWVQPDAPQMAGLGVVSHEHVGADWLHEQGFSQEVSALVRQHVEAKRYLVCRKPRYAAKLSEASRGTLAWQGGAMSDEEADAFEQNPFFGPILALRTWDERAKDPSAQVPNLRHYRRLIQSHLSRETGEDVC